MTGGGGATKLNPARVAVPYGLPTMTDPLAPLSTIAETTLSDTTVNALAATPPKVTEPAPVKPDPLIVKVVPTPPLVGVKEVIAGAARNWNPGRVAVPPG